MSKDDNHYDISNINHLYADNMKMVFYLKLQSFMVTFLNSIK